MENMNSDISARILRYPWSSATSGESTDIVGSHIRIPFMGCPVLALSSTSNVYLLSRMERFRRHGPCVDGVYNHFETPHGVLAGKHIINKIRIVDLTGHIVEPELDIVGAVEKKEGDSVNSKDSILSRLVSSWSQLFDDLLDRCFKDNILGDSIDWSTVIAMLQSISDPNEPRKSLIVEIAQRFSKTMVENVSSMRKVLFRELNFVSLSRIQQLNAKSINWLARQPGITTEQKAGHKQRILGVVRRESHNTLENRVFKDFLVRCHREAVRYLKNECMETALQLGSIRARQVQGYKNLCAMSLAEPVFEGISFPSPGIQPNYVLQNDPRYRELWTWYVRLLKHQMEEDHIWDWQGRMWADVVRLFIGSGMEVLRCEKSTRHNHILKIEAIAQSRLRLNSEQENGARIIPGSLPGPFVIKKTSEDDRQTLCILEVIHSEIAEQHPASKGYGALGAHLYIVADIIKSETKKKHIICVWGINGAGVIGGLNSNEVAESCGRALHLFSARMQSTHEFRGIVIISNLAANVVHTSRCNAVDVINVPADPKYWEDAVVDVASVLQRVFEVIL